MLKDRITSGLKRHFRKLRKASCLLLVSIPQKLYTQLIKSPCIALSWRLKITPPPSSEYCLIFKSKFPVPHPLQLTFFVQITNWAEKYCPYNSLKNHLTERLIGFIPSGNQNFCFCRRLQLLLRNWMIFSELSVFVGVRRNKCLSVCECHHYWTEISLVLLPLPVSEICFTSLHVIHHLIAI